MLRLLKLALFLLFGVIALMGLSGYVVAEAPTVPATVVHDSTLPQEEIGGIPLHLETQGNPDAPVLIALHGGPGNDYRHLLPLKALSDEHLVVLYDQRGAGLSARVDSEQLTLDGFVAELDAIAARYSPDRPVTLVGHSWGGMLASIYTDRHPGRVSDLVVIEPGFLTRGAFADFFEAFGGGMPDFSWSLVGTVWRRGWQAIKVDGPDSDARLDFFVLSLAQSDVPGNPMRGYFCEQRKIANSFSTWRMGARSSMTLQGSAIDGEGQLKEDFTGSGLAGWPHPTLLLAGSCNTVIGPEFQERHHVPLYSDARLQVLEGTGHMMLEEKPQEVLELIRAHLRR